MTTTVSAPDDAAPAPGPKPKHPHWGFGHIPALDGLRGAAVAAVLLYHGGYLTGGYLGVDLFFVLSGFLITSLLLTEHRSTGRIDLGHFWLRRARRLLPALFVVLGGVALYAAVWARPIDLGQVRSSALATTFYVANWQQIFHGSSYWDISLNPSPLQHTWSLAIEEQFYLLWPLVMVVVLRGGGRHRGRRVERLCLTLAALSAAGFVLLHAFGASTTRVYEGTDTRVAAILLGAALAGWRMEHGPMEEQRYAKEVEWLGVAAAVLLGLAWLFLSGTSSLLYWGGLPICSVLAVVVLAAATSRTSSYLRPVLSFRGLMWLGTISYGLYLWHWPVYLVLNEGRTGLSGLPLLALRLATATGIAWLSFRFVESPIRHGALKGKPVLQGVAGALAVLSVIAVLATTSGAVSPLAVNQQAAPTEAAGHVDGAPTVMVVGDSVGNSIAGPMIDDPWSFGVNPVNKAVIGCELMFKGNQVKTSDGSVGTRPDCTADYRAAVAKYRPDVVLLFFGGANSGEVVIDGKAVQACDPEFRAAQEKLHRGAIDDLTSSGAKVALVTLARTDNTGFFPPPWNENITCYNDALRAIAKDTGAELVDLDGWVCPNGTCKAKVDGAPIRPDGLHFNGPGGRAAAAFLVDDALRQAGLAPAASASKVPKSCPALRAAVGPVIVLVGKTSDDARRSSLDRLQYVDLGKVADAAPPAAAKDLRVVADQADAMKDVLRNTPDGTELRFEDFPPAVATALRNLERYLATTCTGA